MPNVPKETKPKICELVECGKEFNRRLREPGGRIKPESIPAYEARKYCDQVCSNKARRKIPVTKVCALKSCGKEFTKRNTHWYAQRYCSRECRDIDARADPTVSRRERKAYLDKQRRERGRKVSLVKTKKRQRELRQKYQRYVSKIKLEEPLHVFPEGPRQEVWRPASWKN